MAVTYITRIYATIDKSIDYIIRDKLILNDFDGEDENIKIKGDKVILTNEAMELQLQREAMEQAESYLDNAIDYIERNKEIIENGKVEIRKTLTSTLNCEYDSAKDEFKLIRELYKPCDGLGKEKKNILGYHVWQSFEEKIDGKVANEIGVKLAEELYGDFQCVISTHTNTDYTHNHIVFNATKMTKGKYHLTTETTMQLRKVSDRLCEEYGLNVLQHTKDMKLTWYQDESGKWKYFELTDRKANIDKGQYSNKNDYRNYEAYKKSEQFKKNQRDIVRADIDKFIPHSDDLEDLISKLEEIGYVVKNLNSTGGQLKYIGFKSPTGDVFLRGKDNSLGEDYSRDNIIKRIEENKKHRQESIFTDVKKKEPVKQGEYTFFNTDIEDLTDERKKYDKKNNSWIIIKRSDLEKYVVADIKKLNSQLDDIYKSTQYKQEPEKHYYGKKGQHYKTIESINDNLRALQFLETKNIQSFQQINDMVSSIHEKNMQIDNELAKIRDYLKEMNVDIVLIKQYNNLKHSIEINKNNIDYVTYELPGEKALLEKYEAILEAKKLVTSVQQADYVTKFEEYNSRYWELAKAKEQLNAMIKRYDETVRTIDRIDREYDRKYRTDIMEYYKISKSNNEEKPSKRNRQER